MFQALHLGHSNTHPKAFLSTAQRLKWMLPYSVERHMQSYFHPRASSATSSKAWSLWAGK